MAGEKGSLTQSKEKLRQPNARRGFPDKTAIANTGLYIKRPRTGIKNKVVASTYISRKAHGVAFGMPSGEWGGICEAKRMIDFVVVERYQIAVWLGNSGLFSDPRERGLNWDGPCG